MAAAPELVAGFRLVMADGEVGDGQAAKVLMGHHMELEGAVELEELGAGADGDREVVEGELGELDVGTDGD